ncbi:MAG: glycine--tRNA ligase subunit beta [Rhodobacterales bacterium RIFCSPHIGHO2_02_FULL_62_130]|nr:MAG: glycine--tRNA ligase subunit beta [Rhodobacterales bacterium RIFCSPHIGHO2_02_FULL_62_130]OHC57283.1 MAG: glycine--tRNA ligase subunit beta [Rhodobacterales bacterium RIFCSPHIGHO2_12_FULL_62_75]HCZ01445.1 glycine--tRNA ligase subunit beta [Rhodobacter sp.]
MADLLIELFSEEIPARMQARAREDLKSLVTNGLVEAGLTYAGAGAFSTPRRLVLTLDGLSAESRPVREERKGPRTDAPAAALEGFLRSTGLTKDQLEVRDDKKAQVYFAVIEKPGRAAPAIIAEVLEHAIRNFPWPKSMRWGSGNLRWVRPLQSILCILTDEAGAQVVPMSVDGIVAGNTTAGHRFLSQGRFAVNNFDDYAVKLKRAFVVLDSAEREAAIWQGAQNLAFAAGMDVVPDAGLLTEVAGLVEWPVPLMGRIADAFLHLPAEVLQTSMREHQKFFSVKNPKTGRIEGFVTVANTDPADHGATILKGNQKVLSARLSDAKFFWENDLRVAKAGMQEWLDGLKAVTFHNKLGSQADRIARIAALAREIAPLVGADADVAEMAAKLAKADLRSSMVGEFPELQGLMGMYYAREAGLPEAVALAARDHYSPLGPTDSVPTDPVSVAVALADKIDTLTGFWAIDEKPTGSKDPFALRRAALGVIRLVLGSRSRLNIRQVLSRGFDEVRFEKMIAEGRSESALFAYPSELLGTTTAAFKDALNEFGRLETLRSIKELLAFIGGKFGPFVEGQARLDFLASTVHFQRLCDGLFAESDLLSFFHDRLKVFLKDQGIRHDVIDACLAMPGNDDLTLLVNRATALAAFLKTEDGPNLLQGYKRANTILTQAEQKDGVEYSFGADVKFAETDEERALFAALDAAEAAITPAMAKEDFAAAMTAMATLRAPIDAFFTAVQVNADNEIIRRNRLNLLHRIRTICSGVADLTKIEG